MLPELSKSSSEIPDSRLNSSVVPDATGCVVTSEDALGGAQGTNLHVVAATTADDIGVVGTALDAANNNLDDGEWTTITRKGRKRFTSQECQCEVGTLDAELQCAVKQAEARLTPDERQRIKKRQIVVNQVSIRLQRSSESDTGSQAKKSSNKRRHSRKRQVAENKISIRSGSSSESEPSSHGEGPSNLERGKGVDPRNWGDLSDMSDMNLEEQETILESCRLAKELVQLPNEDNVDRQQPNDHEGVKLTNKRSERPIGKGKAAPAAPKIVPDKGSLQRNVDKGKGCTKNAAPNPIETLVSNAVLQKTRCTERAATPHAMEPIEQINPKSYIGRAFQRMSKGNPKGKTYQHNESSDSESDTSSSDDESSSDESDTSTTSSSSSSSSLSGSSSSRGS